MEFREVVNGRKSVRKFRPDPVPTQDVLDVIGVAVRAANAGNKQNWRFYAVSNPGMIAGMRDAVDSEIKQIKRAAGRSPDSDRFSIFFGEAPLVIAVASNPYESSMDKLMAEAGMPEDERIRRRQRPDIQSIGGCIQLLLCAAHEKGYGACWMTAPMVARDQLEKILGIEPPAELCALIPVGKPAEDLPGTSRWPLEKVVTLIE
ncbi:MAG: hypothetical protein HPY55_11880 [Firmicutes bacterium]|nr:hypothetical protein [Bacillota bacterium]